METQAECVPAALESLVAGFDNNPFRARLSLRDLFAEQPGAFMRAALPLFTRGMPQAAAEAIARLLLANQALISSVSDPSISSLPEALAVCRAAIATDPSFDVQLARRIGEGGVLVDDHQATRILELLSQLSEPSRVMPQLMQLLRSGNIWIRSKAILLIGRTKKDTRWLEPFLDDADPRLRSNAVEALWGVATFDAIQIFHKAVQDPNHRVAANACVGLHLAGDPEAVMQLEQMANFADPMFQAAAAWAMGATLDPVFTTALQGMVKSPESNVRRAALRGLASIRKRLANS